jgi:hypothetical protein
MRFSMGGPPFRAWSPGLARAAGSRQVDQMRVIDGNADLYQVGERGGEHFSVKDYGDVVGAGAIYSLKAHQNVGFQTVTFQNNHTAYGICINSALLGVNYIGSDTHPVNISYPCILYLGRQA